MRLPKSENSANVLTPNCQQYLYLSPFVHCRTPLTQSQECWLEHYISSRRMALGRDMRLLEFSCDGSIVGRIANNVGGVAYIGYDFLGDLHLSNTRDANRAEYKHADKSLVRSMTFAPPQRESAFDMLLGISQLTMLNELQTRELLTALSSCIAPHGNLVLVENPVVSGTRAVSGPFGEWWLHDIIAYAEGQWDTEVHPTGMSPYCVYVLTRKKAQQSLLTEVDGDGHSKAVTRAYLISAYSDARPEETGHTPLQSDTVDPRDTQMNTREKDTVHRLVALLNKARKRIREQAQHIANVDAAHIQLLAQVADLNREHHRIRAQIGAAARMRDALRDNRYVQMLHNSSSQTIPPSHTEAAPRFIFDAPRDTQWAHPGHHVFSDVLTVFNQEWVGIRAAAGSFPGAKLALSAQMELTPHDIKDIANEVNLRRIRKVLVHGFSAPMIRSLPALRVALEGIPFFGVWHGTLAAWALDSERALAAPYFSLASDGLFSRIHIMRAGAHVIHDKAWPHSLPNLPPIVRSNRLREAFEERPFCALFPSWNNSWKNLYSNLYAASHSREFARILTYAETHSLDSHLRATVMNVRYCSRTNHFQTLSDVDLCLNATIVDCHPMVELEALAVNTPTLRTNLDLDFDRGHPYATLMTVNSPHDIASMAQQIRTIAAMSSAELKALLIDYRDLVTKTSFERYAAFLEV